MKALVVATRQRANANFIICFADQAWSFAVIALPHYHQHRAVGADSTLLNIYHVWKAHIVIAEDAWR